MRELFLFVGFVAVCAGSLYGWYHHTRGRPAVDWWHRSPWRPRLNTAADRVRRDSERDREGDEGRDGDGRGSHDG